MIAFEGIDGSGKTTMSTRAYQTLKTRGLPVAYTFEPTYSRIGSIIHLMLSDDVKGSGSLQALMFAADRVNHFEAEIEPSLTSGVNVLVDRYVYSSIAYQGVALKDEGWVRTINNRVPRADLAIYIDMDPKTGLERSTKRSIFDELEFLEEVRAIYKRMVASGELVEVDGRGSEEEVFSRVWKRVADYLSL